jgi:hypothetical protein
MCAATSESACLTDCNELATACPEELPALSACVADPANTVACMSGQTSIMGCDSQIDALDRCFICVPAAADSECLTCGKADCCEPLADYNLASDGQSFYDCAVACTTQACFDGCVTMYPVAGAAITELTECQNESCAEPCICAPADGDNACLTCAKTSCCAEYVDYSLSADVIDFETCLGACADGDTPCAEACVTQYPVAGGTYLELTTCLDASCLDACTQ